MSVLLSVRAYARHRGVSHVAVLQAIRSQRISRRPDGKIDQEQADRDWRRHTDPTKPRNAVTGRPRARRDLGSPPLPMGAEPGAEAGPGNGRGPGHADPEQASLLRGYFAARAMGENFRARRAKLELEELEGRLVDVDELRAAAFQASRRPREILRAMGATLAPRLAPLSDVGAIAKLIDGEVQRALEELAAGLKLITSPARPAARGSRRRPPR